MAEKSCYYRTGKRPARLKRRRKGRKGRKARVRNPRRRRRVRRRNYPLRVKYRGRYYTRKALARKIGHRKSIKFWHRRKGRKYKHGKRRLRAANRRKRRNRRRGFRRRR